MTGAGTAGGALTRRRHVDLLRVGSAACPRPRTTLR
ncbi:putative leader peptide [Modestobacter sp. SSW1-42]